MTGTWILVACPSCETRVEVPLGSEARCASHPERPAMELQGVVEREAEAHDLGGAPLDLEGVRTRSCRDPPPTFPKAFSVSAVFRSVNC
jgi:hypothetical protein